MNWWATHSVSTKFPENFRFVEEKNWHGATCFHFIKRNHRIFYQGKSFLKRKNQTNVGQHKPKEVEYQHFGWYVFGIYFGRNSGFKMFKISMGSTVIVKISNKGCSHIMSAQNGGLQTPIPPLSAKIRNWPTTPPSLVRQNQKRQKILFSCTPFIEYIYFFVYGNCLRL